MKLNWGSGIAIVYIVFALSMILFAVMASQQKNDLVNEHYYDESVKYQVMIDATHNHSIPGNHLDIEYLQEEEVIVISFAEKQKIIIGEISFYKPDFAEKDFKFKLKLDKEGKQFIPTTQLAKGAWNLKTSYVVNGLDCYNEEKIFIQ